MLQRKERVFLQACSSGYNSDDDTLTVRRDEASQAHRGDISLTYTCHMICHHSLTRTVQTHSHTHAQRLRPITVRDGWPRSSSTTNNGLHLFTMSPLFANCLLQLRGEDLTASWLLDRWGVWCVSACAWLGRIVFSR